MKKHRTWQYVLMATVLFIVAIAGSCSTFPPFPDSLNEGYTMRAVARYQAVQP